MHLYEVLKRPVITEKTTDTQDQANQFVFEVDRRSNKMMVKQAVEERFEVEVVKVNIIIMKAKTRRRGMRARSVRVTPWKKAIVTLASGNSIQLFEGV